MSYSQSLGWDRPKTYKDMLIPYFRSANGNVSKCVRPIRVSLEAMDSAVRISLSRVGINT